MQHYEVEDWVQLAAGKAHPDLAREMREHVAEGCPRCTDRMRRWTHERRASNAGSRDRRDDRRSRQLTLVRTVPLEGAELADLFYDSFESGPVGVRATDGDSRHLFYQSGSFVLDINLEIEPETGRVSLAGQILHHPDPLGGVSNLRVFLVEGNGEAVAETRTNDVGEFVLEFDAERRLRLALVVNDKRAIVIPSTGLRVKHDASRLETGKRKKKRASGDSP